MNGWQIIARPSPLLHIAPSGRYIWAQVDKYGNDEDHPAMEVVIVRRLPLHEAIVFYEVNGDTHSELPTSFSSTYPEWVVAEVDNAGAECHAYTEELTPVT